ncbi:hypothetical protein LINPERPRIM_LOCUS25554 [Linum perenne]
MHEFYEMFYQDLMG